MTWRWDCMCRWKRPEQLKREYGNCVVTSVPQLAEIEVGGNLMGISGAGQTARLVRQRFLAEILEPRARELFTMLRNNLREGGVLEALGAGCVLTGGGANLVGLARQRGVAAKGSGAGGFAGAAVANAAGVGEAGVRGGDRDAAVHASHADSTGG